LPDTNTTKVYTFQQTPKAQLTVYVRLHLITTRRSLKPEGFLVSAEIEIIMGMLTLFSRNVTSIYL
jgi:hypothetical protein